MQAERLANAQTGGEHDCEQVLEFVAGWSMQEGLGRLGREWLGLVDARAGTRCRCWFRWSTWTARRIRMSPRKLDAGRREAIGSLQITDAPRDTHCYHRP